jgi:DNA helicase-2/ATP-dependent DNA helicase PcrA
MEHNINQDIVIKSNNNYTLVVACPGSGKTHTLIYKYINLINNNISPEEIILITFTKKAGNEMNKRILSCNEEIPYYVGSLHGFAYKILNNNKILNNHIIIDETNSSTTILSIINNNNNLQLLDQKDKLKIFNIIDKININYPVDILKTLNNNELYIYNKDIKLIYKEYNKFKKKNNLFDFNDLMILLCKFLDSDKSIELKNKIKYIFFDEYQDINPIQQYILNSFKSNSNIILFGDDSQSIYSFRGSSIDFILNFKENFNLVNKTLNTYYLINNYRSSPEIINFCQNIIKNNNIKINKNVNAINNTHKIPEIYGFNYKNQEYEWLINDSDVNDTEVISCMVCSLLVVCLCSIFSFR